MLLLRTLLLLCFRLTDKNAPLSVALLVQCSIELHIGLLVSYLVGGGPLGRDLGAADVEGRLVHGRLRHEGGGVGHEAKAA